MMKNILRYIMIKTLALADENPQKAKEEEKTGNESFIYWQQTHLF